MRTSFYALIFFVLCSCKIDREVTVDDLINDYEVEEIQKLLEIKVDSLSSLEESNEDLFEFSKKVETETILETLDVKYGTDNRIDFYDETNIYKINNTSGVVALMHKDSLKKESNNYKLKATSFEERVNLCSNEKFRTQPLGAFCSGFVVGKNLIATAGHCIEDTTKLKDIRFVLDYKLFDESQDEENIEFEESLVLTGKRIVSILSIKNGLDYAIVETNQEIPIDRILNLDYDSNIRTNHGVYVIGHPLGLPLKIADSAFVRDKGSELYFKANLDTYGVNSGSPVFSSRSHEVVGILISGERDFIKKRERNEDCLKSKQCGDSECKGESIIRISIIKSLLNNQSIL